ncbi:MULTISPECIES: hypothetical protein [unclassified Brenneria]|uniref:hypothetical protein n=1 Tax=unclassified Brenneria TaxID=2634434 RepID=UPI0029C37070|nr:MULTISPECIES: hypothetical protein [unclassified Brenneria]MDX5629557.1 hypothetical protein [Brenneria sp. L3-3Z]MDX5696696.1 hypothetical protein [Brenneria sp. L4-2C]
MANHHSSESNSPIKTGDFREYRFYAMYLNVNHRINLGEFKVNDLESYRRAINRAINQLAPQQDKERKLLQGLDDACRENILPENEFDWLRQSERATFWLWGYLLLESDSTIGIPFYQGIPPSENSYHRLKLAPSPSSSQVKSSQVKSSQVKSSQVKSRTIRCDY